MFGSKHLYMSIHKDGIFHTFFLEDVTFIQHEYWDDPRREKIRLVFWLNDAVFIKTRMYSPDVKFIVEQWEKYKRKGRFDVDSLILRDLDSPGGYVVE